MRRSKNLKSAGIVQGRQFRQVERALGGIADQHGCLVDQQLVHAVLAQQRAVELEAGFHVDLVDATARQFGEDGVQLDLAGRVWHFHDLGILFP